MKSFLTLSLLTASFLSCDAFVVVRSASNYRQTMPNTNAAISPESTPVRSALAISNANLKIKPGETVLEPYYGIPNGILLAAPSLLVLHAAYFSPDGLPTPLAWAGAAIHLILGYYIYTQTNRVRCVFDKKTFEFKNIDKKTNTLVTKPNKNYVKGTLNRWTCNTVVDFGYFPSKSYPLITWFKETETGADQWGEYGLWGKVWSNPSPTSPSIHFFPGFIDMDTFEKEMIARGATKKSG